MPLNLCDRHATDRKRSSNKNRNPVSLRNYINAGPFFWSTRILRILLIAWRLQSPQEDSTECEAKFKSHQVVRVFFTSPPFTPLTFFIDKSAKFRLASVRKKHQTEGTAVERFRVSPIIMRPRRDFSREFYNLYVRFRCFTRPEKYTKSGNLFLDTREITQIGEIHFFIGNVWIRGRCEGGDERIWSNYNEGLPDGPKKLKLNSRSERGARNRWDFKLEIFSSATSEKEASLPKEQ